MSPRFPRDANDSDGILGAADGALLAAKARGRDCVHSYGDEAPAIMPAEADESPLSGLGYRFAVRAGLTHEEAVALAAALQVLGTSRPGPQLHLAGENGAGPGPGSGGPAPAFSHLFSALLYGTERWDGRGYPEGLRGESIPRVARAFAVLRAYAADSREPVTAVRAGAGKSFDPRMVNRFLAFLAEEARRWSPLDSRDARMGP